MNYTDKVTLEKYIEHEWKTEQLDSTIFNLGYCQEEQNNYKKIFKENFLNFSTFEKLKISDISPSQLYRGDTLEELKKNISYMNKDVDYIQNSLDSSNIMPSLFIRKDNKIEILGGRTRASIQRCCNKEHINAFIIDKSKLGQYFTSIREKEFLEDGYGILSLDKRNALVTTLMEIKHNSNKPDLQRIKKRTDTFDNLTNEQIIDELIDIANHLYMHKNYLNLQNYKKELYKLEEKSLDDLALEAEEEMKKIDELTASLHPETSTPTLK